MLIWFGNTLSCYCDLCWGRCFLFGSLHPDSARDDYYNIDTRKIIRKPSRQINIVTMSKSYIMYGCLEEEKGIARVFTFIAIHTSENYDGAVATFAVVQNFQNVQGKHGRAFPSSQKLYNMKDNVVLKVLYFSQAQRVSCRCGESALIHSSSFPLNAVCTTHFMLLAVSFYESKDHMCNMQTEINPVGKRK